MNLLAQLTEPQIVQAVMKSQHLVRAIQEAIAECVIEVRVNRSNIVKAGLERARRRGLKLGRPSVLNLVNTPLILDMRMRGASYRTIVKETGYSHGTVQRVVKRAEDSGLLLMDYIERKTNSGGRSKKEPAIKSYKPKYQLPKLKAGEMPYDLRPYMEKRNNLNKRKKK